jgi:hypothetical protein
MIDFKTAEAIAENELREIEKNSRIELGFVNNIEFEFGWMFFFQSKEFIRTGDMGLLLGGNSPIIVDKYNSSVHRTGTRRDSNFYIQKYSQFRDDIETFNKEIRK